MQKKFALIGTSCVGKTTLMNSLAKSLQEDLPGIMVETVEEAARFYFTYNKTQEPFSFFHQGKIQTVAKIQEQLAHFKNPHIVITDRSVLDAIAYTKTINKNNSWKKLLEKEERWIITYTHFFLLDPKGVPFKTDNIRKEQKIIREAFHKSFLELLSLLKLPYTLVSGKENARLELIKKTILSYEEFL